MPHTQVELCAWPWGLTASVLSPQARRKLPASAKLRGKAEISCVRISWCLLDEKQMGCKSVNNLHMLKGQ